MGATPRRSPLKEAVLATDWAPTVHRTKPARRLDPLPRRTGYLADARVPRRHETQSMPNGLAHETGSGVADRNDHGLTVSPSATTPTREDRPWLSTPFERPARAPRTHERMRARGVALSVATRCGTDREGVRTK